MAGHRFRVQHAHNRRPPEHPVSLTHIAQSPPSPEHNSAAPETDKTLACFKHLRILSNFSFSVLSIRISSAASDCVLICPLSATKVLPHQKNIPLRKSKRRTTRQKLSFSLYHRSLDTSHTTTIQQWGPSRFPTVAWRARMLSSPVVPGESPNPLSGRLLPLHPVRLTNLLNPPC